MPAVVIHHLQSSSRITTHRADDLIEGDTVDRPPDLSGFPAVLGSPAHDERNGPWCHPAHSLGPLFIIILHKFPRFRYVIFTYEGVGNIDAP